MAVEKDERIAYMPMLCGRRRIYTDEWYVDERNVISVLQETITQHDQNAEEMRYLLAFEKGSQPLMRTKTVRADVNVEAIDNVANQIVMFWCGYSWGNPILYIQRGSKDMSGSDDEANTLQDNAITMLNEMNEIEYAQTKDQELARYVEICGVGYQMIDVRPKFDGISAFDLMTLNPLFTYCIYRNNARRDKIAGVTFHTSQDSGNTYYTVFTQDKRFEILNQTKIVDEFGNTQKTDIWKLVKDEKTGYPYFLNPFDMVPIVEFDRAADRTGVFERQISEMTALNIESSDFVNLFCQSVQEIWWGVDFELPKDENGKPLRPANGQWLLGKSINGGKPDLKPLHSDIDFDGIQKNLETRRDLILQKCYVPLQSEPGGGSTGTAMSMSSGWAAAESVAAMKEQMMFRGKMEIVQLEIQAINTTTGIAEDSPLLQLKPSDVKPQFTRNKTYDLVSKVNAMVTMIKSGVNGRVAFETVNLFPDVAQAWADSKEVVEKYQTAIINRAENTYVSAYTKREDAEASEGGKAGSDESDQIVNSPIVNTYPGGQEATTAMRSEKRTGSDIL